MEIFTLVTGVLFLILEIRQHNWMWILQMVSGAASVIVFFRQGLYASMALNLYYVLIALWGFMSWKRDSEDVNDGKIHLRTLTLPVVLWSILIQIVGTLSLMWILRITGDPMSGLDAGTSVLAIIATWWLGRSYKEQWFLWIVCNILVSVMCASQQMWWMTVLYVFYTLSSVYGYVHWKKEGQYL